MRGYFIFSTWSHPTVFTVTIIKSGCTIPKLTTTASASRFSPSGNQFYNIIAFFNLHSKQLASLRRGRNTNMLATSVNSQRNLLNDFFR